MKHLLVAISICFFLVAYNTNAQNTLETENIQTLEKLSTHIFDDTLMLLSDGYYNVRNLEYNKNDYAEVLKIINSDLYNLAYNKTSENYGTEEERFTWQNFETGFWAIIVKPVSNEFTHFMLVLWYKQ